VPECTTVRIGRDETIIPERQTVSTVRCSPTPAAIVRISGGLGNQLFQAAFACAIARQRGCAVAVDPATTRDGVARSYMLDRVTRAPAKAEAGAIGRLRGWPMGRLGDVSLRITRRLRPQIPHRWVIEREGCYDPELTTDSSRTYFQGYWQDYRYFSNCWDVLQHDLMPAGDPPPRCAHLLETARHTGSVMIHIRRGDYVSNPANAAFHGILDARYYAAALAWLAETGVGPIIPLIFSDDPHAARSLLQWPEGSRFVTVNGPDDAIEDLRIMQSCRHHILANSSLSWWAAAMRNRPDGVVIAPKRWYASLHPANETIHLPNWIRI